MNARIFFKKSKELNKKKRERKSSFKSGSGGPKFYIQWKVSAPLRSPCRLFCLDIELCVKSWGVWDIHRADSSTSGSPFLLLIAPVLLYNDFLYWRHGPRRGGINIFSFIINTRRLFSPRTPTSPRHAIGFHPWIGSGASPIRELFLHHFSHWVELNSGIALFKRKGKTRVQF